MKRPGAILVRFAATTHVRPKRCTRWNSVALCVLLGCATTLRGDGFTRFVDDAGRFEALFAGTPLQSSSPIKTPWGEGLSHTFSVTELSGSMVVSYLDYPPVRGSWEEVIASAISAGVRPGGGQLRSRHSISANGMTGEEIVIDVKTSAIRTRLFLIDERLYQVAYFFRTENTSSERAERFFASFKAWPKAR